MPSVWIEERHGGYVVRWRDANGKHTSTTYTNKAAALSSANELRQRLGPTRRRRKAGPRPVERLTIDQVIEKWAADQPRVTPGADAYVAEVTETVKRVTKLLLWTTPSDAEVGAVKTYLHDRGGKGRRGLSYVRLVLRWAAKELDQPLDPKVDAALAAPPSKEAIVDLLKTEHVASIRDRAKELEQHLLIDCLLIYGWRPVTGCRLKVADFNDDEETIRIAVKHNGSPWTHPLFPFHAEQIRQSVAGRAPEDALFLNPSGAPWRLKNGNGGAEQLEKWYSRCVQPKDSGEGGIYQLKRWAITQMDAGAAPWKQRLSLAQIALYTGHRTKTQIVRYLRTNLDEARSVMGDEDRGGNSPGQKGAIPFSGMPNDAEDDDRKPLIFPVRAV